MGQYFFQIFLVSDYHRSQTCSPLHSGFSLLSLCLLDLPDHKNPGVRESGKGSTCLKYLFLASCVSCHHEVDLETSPKGSIGLPELLFESFAFPFSCLEDS